MAAEGSSKLIIVRIIRILSHLLTRNSILRMCYYFMCLCTFIVLQCNCISGETAAVIDACPSSCVSWNPRQPLLAVLLDPVLADADDALRSRDKSAFRIISLNNNNK